MTIYTKLFTLSKTTNSLRFKAEFICYKTGYFGLLLT